MATPANSFFFILAGNKHMHENMDEFELMTDPTTDRSYLPLSTKKSTYYLVATLAPSFLIAYFYSFR